MNTIKYVKVNQSDELTFCTTKSVSINLLKEFIESKVDWYNIKIEFDENTGNYCLWSETLSCDIITSKSLDDDVISFDKIQIEYVEII